MEKAAYFCSACGHEFAKWSGRCSACGEWNTLELGRTSPKASAPTRRARASEAVLLSALSTVSEIRFSTGIAELDRVLGGGAVLGSLVLVGGEPGVGKSTLLLQICGRLSKTRRVLYVTGEESATQLRLRAARLCVSDHDALYVLAETSWEYVDDTIKKIRPDVLVVDSIQTMRTESVGAAPGSVGQVKACTLLLMELAKERGVTVFVIGHLNKEGAIAGPRVLEHMVDCVLSFEGDKQLSHRILRATKNRFGSTNEIGMFEMAQEGLREVTNPSAFLLAGRPIGASGDCVACVLEGTRPVMAEVQALITPTSFGTPRRMVSGIDYNRAMLLLAVLEKRGGLRTGACDAYINVVGGLSCEEPAVDLPTLMACASAMLDEPIGSRVCAMGEVGLSGEVRAIVGMPQRIAEAARLGFHTCVVPAGGKKIQPPDGVKLMQVRHIREALAAVRNAE